MSVKEPTHDSLIDGAEPVTALLIEHKVKELVIKELVYTRCELVL
jgi:hypothetical protein